MAPSNASAARKRWRSRKRKGGWLRRRSVNSSNHDIDTFSQSLDDEFPSTLGNKRRLIYHTAQITKHTAQNVKPKVRITPLSRRGDENEEDDEEEERCMVPSSLHSLPMTLGRKNMVTFWWQACPHCSVGREEQDYPAHKIPLHLCDDRCLRLFERELDTNGNKRKRYDILSAAMITIHDTGALELVARFPELVHVSISGAKDPGHQEKLLRATYARDRIIRIGESPDRPLMVFRLEVFHNNYDNLDGSEHNENQLHRHHAKRKLVTPSPRALQRRKNFHVRNEDSSDEDDDESHSNNNTNNALQQSPTSMLSPSSQWIFPPTKASAKLRNSHQKALKFPAHNCYQRYSNNNSNINHRESTRKSLLENLAAQGNPWGDDDDDDADDNDDLDKKSGGRNTSSASRRNTSCRGNKHYNDNDWFDTPSSQSGEGESRITTPRRTNSRRPQQQEQRQQQRTHLQNDLNLGNKEQQQQILSDNKRVSPARRQLSFGKMSSSSSNTQQQRENEIERPLQKVIVPSSNQQSLSALSDPSHHGAGSDNDDFDAYHDDIGSQPSLQMSQKPRATGGRPVGREIQQEAPTKLDTDTRSPVSAKESSGSGDKSLGGDTSNSQNLGEKTNREQSKDDKRRKQRNADPSMRVPNGSGTDDFVPPRSEFRVLEGMETDRSSLHNADTPKVALRPDHPLASSPEHDSSTSLKIQSPLEYCQQDSQPSGGSNGPLETQGVLLSQRVSQRKYQHQSSIHDAPAAGLPSICFRPLACTARDSDSSRASSQPNNKLISQNWLRQQKGESQKLNVLESQQHSRAESHFESTSRTKAVETQSSQQMVIASQAKYTGNIKPRKTASSLVVRSQQEGSRTIPRPSFAFTLNEQETSSSSSHHSGGASSQPVVLSSQAAASVLENPTPLAALPSQNRDQILDAESQTPPPSKRRVLKRRKLEFRQPEPEPETDKGVNDRIDYRDGSDESSVLSLSCGRKDFETQTSMVEIPGSNNSDILSPSQNLGLAAEDSQAEARAEFLEKQAYWENVQRSGKGSKAFRALVNITVAKNEGDYVEGRKYWLPSLLED